MILTKICTKRKVLTGVIFTIILCFTILLIFLLKTEDRRNITFSQDSYNLSKLERVPFSMNSNSDYVPFYQVYPNGDATDTYIICEGYENIKNKSIVSKDDILKIIKSDNLKIIFFYLFREQNAIIGDEVFDGKNTVCFTNRYIYNPKMTFSPVSIFFEQDKKFYFNGELLTLDETSTYAQKVVIAMKKFSQQKSDRIVFLQHGMMWYKQKFFMRVVKDFEISKNDNYYEPFDGNFSTQEVEEINEILDNKKAKWLLVCPDLSYGAFFCDPNPCFPANMEVTDSQ